MVNKPETKQVYYSYRPPDNTENLLEEFEQNHRSYQLFKQKGLDKIQLSPADIDVYGKPIYATEMILNDGPFRQIRDFLNRVDLSKGPIQRQVDKLERRRDADPEMHTKVEHLVVHVTWVAYDFLPNLIKAYDVKEGMYNYPITRIEIVNGKRITKYVNWQARYDIPFTAKAVDEALQDNISSAEDIRFLVRPSNTIRDDSFSLEQFRDSTWEQVVDISRQGKGLNR